MKKTKTETLPPVRSLLTIRILSTMKFMIAFMLFACLQVSARGLGQNTITLKMNEADIKKVLFTIEKKTDYRFLFSEDLVKNQPRVTIDVTNAKINDVLDKVLAGTGIFYRITDTRLVILKGNSESENDAADIRITGKVTSATGEPLAGASISVKGSRTGTTTDANGNFAITVPDDAILVISSVGYESIEVSVKGKTSIDAVLKVSEKVQDAVVVIGYGTAAKRDLTGSIQKVAGKEVADKPNTNPVASLQGKVAGLTVVNSGVPGQEPDIRIRGTVSLYSTKPLYVVDGILNDNINFLNPADIESIEVLKDPSSLAIFGVQGANGVIAVTTKRGKTGKPVVNFNTSVGFKNIVDKPALTDATQFKLLYDEQRANQSLPPFAYYNQFTGNSDWVALIENKNAIMNINNISISSGTDRNKFYMGLGYTREEGLIRYEKLDRITVNLNDELRVSKAIKLGFNVSGMKTWLPQVGNFNSSLIATPIVEPFNATKGVYNRLPDEIGGPQIANPLMIVEETRGTRLSDEHRLVGSLFADVTFLKNFNFRVNMMSDFGFNEARRYVPLIQVYGAETDVVTFQGGYTRTEVNQSKNNFYKFQQDYLLTYKKQFGDHGLTLLGGFTTTFNELTGISGTVKQYTSRDPIPRDKRFWYLSVSPFGDPTTRTSNSAQWQRATASGLFRALYNYQNKYLLNASFRRDGSSQISPANRTDNFWALGAAWEVTRENFMQNQKIFDYLKVKASTGKLGNQAAIEYPYYPGYVEGSTAVFGELIVPAYILAYDVNPNLKWETVTSYEGGVEMDLFKRKLHFEANYYVRKTKDLLAFVIDGARRYYNNAGSIQNKGVELLASWASTTKFGLGYRIAGNLTTINNKVLSVFRSGYRIIDGVSRTFEGFPIAHFYGFVHEGIYQSIADKIASPNAAALGTYGPGDIKYKDLNGDGVINDDDRTIIGNPTPDFTYGLSGSLSYKGFELTADFQGVYGNEIWRSWGNGSTFAQFNYRKARLDRWNGPGTSNWEPQLDDTRSINKLPSTYMIEDGSYFRLRNLQLGYTFKPEWLKKFYITSCKLFVNAQNLKTWKRNSGFTPEAGGSATSFGIDSGGYPIPSITSVGLNINF